MKLTIGWDGTDETLVFARQLGVTHVKAGVGDYLDDKRQGPVILGKLRRDMKRIEAHDLKIGVVLLPQEEGSQHWNIRLGRPEREQEIMDVCESLNVLGGEGIPVVEYVFNLAAVYGSQRTTNGRGGAEVRHFDYDYALQAPAVAEFSAADEVVWERITFFLEHVIPVAEKAGIKLACHPDDPPVPTLRGETRVLGSWAGMVRLIESFPSEVNGFNFCQGTIAEMGVDVIEAIHYFGSRGRINHVHFRNIKGAVPCFDECFIDDGDVNMHDALRAYRDAGYTGTIMPDHWPGMGAGNAQTARAFALGYMKAMMEELGVLER